jgi:hypothetical protein
MRRRHYVCTENARVQPESAPIDQISKDIGADFHHNIQRTREVSSASPEAADAQLGAARRADVSIFILAFD